jgi:APA family basic amino acid/polyamine antiporter
MAGLDAGGRSPRAAVLTMGAVVAGLVATGDVYATWSLSAFTVLLYYAVTHLAALWLPATERRVPRGVAVAGLGGCLGLAFWVEPAVWAGGLGILAVGFLLRAVVARRGARGTPDPQVRP